MKIQKLTLFVHACKHDKIPHKSLPPHNHIPTNLLLHKDMPDLQGREEEQLHDEDASSQVLVDRVRVGLGAAEEAEGDEGEEQQHQRQDEAGVGRHVLCDGRLGEEL